MPSTLNDRIKAWEILQGNLKPEIGEVPHLAADLSHLERLLTSGKALEDARQHHLKTGAARGARRFLSGSPPL